MTAAVDGAYDVADRRFVERPRPVRTSPHDVRIEEALLGGCLLAREAIAAALDARVRPESFYKPAHATVFDAVVALYGAGEPVDPNTVAATLESAGTLETVGGFAGLVGLASNAPAISNTRRYGVIIVELCSLRRLIFAAAEIAELAYSRPDDVRVALDAAQAMIADIVDDAGDRKGPRAVRDLLAESLDRLEALYERGDEITGIATGYLDLDDMLNGLAKGSLTLVGARPAVGKSSFALGLALHAAIVGRRPVLFLSLEMSEIEVTQRAMASEARVDSRRFRNGKLSDNDWDKLNVTIDRLAGAPLWIDGSSSPSVLDIRSKARAVKAAAGGLDLIVVDYVGLLGGWESESEVTRMTKISRALKVLASDLDVAVVALAQVNRSLEQRADKRPLLSDLRESGQLEANADVVVFLYRDELYNRDSTDRGIAEVLVAKNRNGPTGMCRLAFLGQYTRFANMARN